MPGRAIVAGAAILVIAVTGCGRSATKPANPAAPDVSPVGDIPDNQAYVPYGLPHGGFTVKVPEGWSRSNAGGAVTFTDKLNAIRVETVAAKLPPTVRDVKRTELPRLAASTRGFTAGTVTSVTRRAGTGIRATYLADARANAVTGKAGRDAVERYAFFHRGHDAVLTLSGPKGADNVDPWRIVTDSVRWTR